MRPGSIPWLASHELRLAWRDWRSMITAGNKRRFSSALLILLVVVLAFHLLAWAIVAPFADAGTPPTMEHLVVLSFVIVLYSSLLLSQSLEQVTRTLYSRGDLDLVMSSPVPPAKVFAVRIASNVLLIAGMAVGFTAPAVDVLVVIGGIRWAAAYGVAVAVAMVAGSLSVAVTIGLFRLLGPKRTRLVAQIVAAVVGAAFAIGIQAFAILNYGNLMQAQALVTPEAIAHFPGETSLIWLPARAAFGDLGALAAIAGVAVAALALTVALFAPRLGEHSIAATDIATAAPRHRRERAFTVRSPRWSMRRKEWLLLRRDPWLVSQTLTQLLYLVPPALLLAHSYGTSTGSLVIVVMVMVTVGGQLGGALGWLAISGEDAPDLVATAPIRPAAVVRAKVEAVVGAIAIGFAPLLVGFAIIAPVHALLAAAGIAVASLSTLQIQLWFRAQARRTQFRRRHTSSRIATFAEALISFSWAAAFGLAAAGTWVAAGSVVIALLILLGTRAVSPRKAFA